MGELLLNFGTHFDDERDGDLLAPNNKKDRAREDENEGYLFFSMDKGLIKGEALSKTVEGKRSRQGKKKGGEGRVERIGWRDGR